MKDKHYIKIHLLTVISDHKLYSTCSDCSQFVIDHFILRSVEILNCLFFFILFILQERDAMIDKFKFDLINNGLTMFLE